MGIESSCEGQALPEEETFSWANLLQVEAGKTFRGDWKWGISARKMLFSDSPKFKLEEKKKSRKDLEVTPVLQSQVSSITGPDATWPRSQNLLRTEAVHSILLARKFSCAGSCV